MTEIKAVERFPEKHQKVYESEPKWGAGERMSLRACLYTKKNFVCENHVNVITKTKKSTMSLNDLLPHIQKKEAVDVLRKITGNTQISKNELEKLLPIWI